MKRAFCCAALVWFLVGCGYNNNSQGSGGTTSGLKFRAFVAQSVASGFTTPSLIIVDASKDVLARVAGIGAASAGVGRSPVQLAVSPNKKLTLSYSSGDNVLALVNNSTEQVSGTVTLSGPTESFVISSDNSSAYVAIPTALVNGHSPGQVQVISLGSGAATTTVPIPAVRYLAETHDGNRLLTFSDNSDTLGVVVPSNIGTTTDPLTLISGFDRPVAALFSSDDRIAYVLNCGAECGGTSASVQLVDMTANPPVLLGAPIPVPAATVGVLNGSTLYVAGTPPDTPCTTGSAAFCGTVATIDVAGGGVISTSEITDGYHNRIGLGADGQLFIGAKTCHQVLPPATDTRGCLSILNTTTSTVVIPEFNGDVTGIEPIPNRHVVYVTQGGELKIYDTTTDAPQAQQVDIFGSASDVKMVDF